MSGSVLFYTIDTNMLLFYGHFQVDGWQTGWGICKGNEAKLKMRQPSESAHSGFEPRDAGYAVETPSPAYNTSLNGFVDMADLH